ncbi:MAG: phage holin family protein [Solirubrobacteraceae bacterium]
MNSQDEDLRQQSVAELVQRLATQTQTLVRQELQLAQAEMRQKGRQAGLGVGMFGGSGLLVLFGLGALVTAAILALATAVSPWLAALIVAVVLFAVAGGLALTGKHELDEATPPTPERAIDEGRNAVDEIRTNARHA